MERTVLCASIKNKENQQKKKQKQIGDLMTLTVPQCGSTPHFNSDMI